MSSITDEQTAVIQKLIREIVNDPSTYIGSKYLPSIAVPSRKVRNEVIEASGGVTNEHVPGTQPKYIQSFGSRVQEFIAPEYKEAIHYDEPKILWLRELGQTDTSKRGIKQYIDNDSDRLNRRIEARIELLRWTAILGGAFSWMGATFSYGIPNANLATPLGGNWSTDGINANNSANPLIDYHRDWTTGGLSQVPQDTKSPVCIMNGNTARWFCDQLQHPGLSCRASARIRASANGTSTRSSSLAVPGAPAGFWRFTTVCWVSAGVDGRRTNHLSGWNQRGESAHGWKCDLLHPGRLHLFRDQPPGWRQNR